MTYSLCARCPRTGEMGVAVMTHMLGAGKLVSHATAHVGAAASQAFMNPYLAVDGLDALAEGASAQAALDRLVSKDPGRDGRQFGLVDGSGGSAAWTGTAPEDWKGHRTGDGYAAQGNRLAGPEVLDAAVEAFHRRPDAALVDRLVAALDAGERAGGDWKGHRSATVLVVQDEAYPLWDLRVDHAEDPLADLHALYQAVTEHLLEEVQRLPTRENPMGAFDFERSEESV